MHEFFRFGYSDEIFFKLCKGDLKFKIILKVIKTKLYLCNPPYCWSLPLSFYNLANGLFSDYSDFSKVCSDFDPLSNDTIVSVYLRY